MKKILMVFVLFFMQCDKGNLPIFARLPKKLKEVSGIEYNQKTNDFWMLNDSGNANKLYRVSLAGKITQVLEVDKKNHDWEDLTQDDNGNFYIGDIGNNNNKRKNLRILIVENTELDEKKAEIKKIEFSYSDQKKFPPKKENLIFDAESLIYFSNYLYIFTKSRIKNHFGKTNVYKVPAKKGQYKAEFISTYENCPENSCWITSAAISPDKSKLVLLSQSNLIVFSNFKSDDFFSGDKKVIPFTSYSQKESVSFKDNNTVYIADERSKNKGGNLYELQLN